MVVMFGMREIPPRQHPGAADSARNVFFWIQNHWYAAVAVLMIIGCVTVSAPCRRSGCTHSLPPPASYPYSRIVCAADGALYRAKALSSCLRNNRNINCCLCLFRGSVTGRRPCRNGASLLPCSRIRFSAPCLRRAADVRFCVSHVSDLLCVGYSVLPGSYIIPQPEGFVM